MFGADRLFIFHAAVAEDPEVARLLDDQFQLYLTSQTEPSESLARSPTGGEAGQGGAGRVVAGRGGVGQGDVG